MAYDAQKAHEYYEKNKKLKGTRATTKGMNASQKQKALEARAYLGEQKKQANKSASEDAKKQKEAIRADFSSRCSAIVDQLRQKLKSMSPEMRKQYKDAIQSRIKDIRASFSEQKKAGQSDVSEKTKAIKAGNEATYQKNLLDAYNQIRGSKK